MSSTISSFDRLRFVPWDSTLGQSVSGFMITNVSDWFGAIVSADDVDRPKPAPDVYLEACRRLGADPADAVALEDTATGLAAARAAGMRTIGVPSVSTAALEADLVARSLLDPTVLAFLGLTPDG